MSWTAKPSRRNSGFHASSAPGTFSPTSSASRAAVPTGTVDLPTTSSPGCSTSSSDSVAASTYRRSAAYSPRFCGVPTQTKCTCAPAASAMSVLKRSRPVASVRASSSSKPGS